MTDGSFTVEVSTRRQPRAVVQEAALTLADRAWVLLGPAAGPRRVAVHVTPRNGAGEAELRRDLADALAEARRRRELAAKGAAGAQALVIEAAGGKPPAPPEGDGAPDTTPGRFPVPYAWRRVAPDTVVLTNPFGDWFLLSDADFERYRRRAMSKGDPLYDALAERNFVGGSLQGDKVRREVADRLSWLHRGPFLHILVVTLRCDHTCLYCHASRAPMAAGPSHDMTRETAEAVIDRVFESPNPFLTVEFQGGEPLANFDVVRHAITYAEERNREVGKRLAFALVTNTSLMDEAKLDFLVAHRVQICTSVDGPADLHNANRLLTGADSHARVAHWIRRINERYAALGLDPGLYRAEALLTVTRDTLPRWKEVIDTYVALGCRSIFLRALNPFGFARRTRDRIGYPIEDWLAFYRRSLDYIIDLNLRGTEVIERTAAIFLTKILSGVDPNYLDIRSPCGAGTGQIAYQHDGRVYTCDEGRMVAAGGDEIFRMGHAVTDTYPTLMGAQVVRSMVMSSALDGVPGCATCVYKPYCGICPVHNYAEQGSLSGRMPESSWCKRHMGILDHLFGLLARARTDPALDGLLRRWTTMRPREHFVQDGRGAACAAAR